MEEEKKKVQELLESLREACLEKSENKESDSRVEEILDSLVEISKILTTLESTEFMTDPIFAKLLSDKSEVIVAKTGKTIAEFSKTEFGRQTCTNEEFVKILIALLKSTDLEILTQASRALGNICYENVKGKTMIRENEGLKNILKVLQKGVDLGEKEGGQFLRNVVTGFLVNYLVDQNLVEKEVIKEEVLPGICSILEVDGVLFREAGMQSLLILGVLNDVKIQFLNERLLKVLVQILAADSSPEFSEMCLEILHGQADDEDAKVLLAEGGVCQLILDLLEKHGPECTSEETRSVLKVACNLIILILTGDKSMNIVYESPVFKKLIAWMDNSDEDLQMTAVMAMGNFARADKICETMVDQGVHLKLLELLSHNNTKSGDIRFQHDLLSALRNLVITEKNKSTVLSDGLLEILTPMFEIQTFPVVFKLFGTLRIVVGGQQEAAITLGKNVDLIKKAIEGSGTDEHPGVKGEASRLLAWLIINSREKEVVDSIINHGGVKSLVKMLDSKYALMQIESLLSLNILTAMCLSHSENSLLDSEVGPTLSRFLKEKAPTLEPPIVYNALTLTLNLAKSDTLRDHLKKSEVHSSWKEILTSRRSELEKAEEKLKVLSSSFDFD